MIRIKNKDILNCYNFLINLNLSLVDSRLRSKFCIMLAKHNDDVYYPCREQVIHTYAIDNEKGEKIIPNDKIKEYYNEIKILENEELLIECNELNKMVILCINDILLDPDIIGSLDGENALTHNLLCDIFEEAVKCYN